MYREKLAILSGRAALKMIQMYSAYFSFADAVWDPWRLGTESRYTTCLDIICVVQDGAHRLIIQVDLPKIRVLDVCRVKEGAEYDDAVVQQTARAIQLKHDACPKCVDFLQTYGQVGYFSSGWQCVERHTLRCVILCPFSGA